MSQIEFSRREVLGAAGVVAAGMVASNVAEAGSHGGHAHTMMNHPKVFEAARDCLTKGHACLDHCIMLISMNDTSIAGCIAQVNLMLPMCQTLAKYANTNATYLKKLAAVCIDVCGDCEKECRKHADHHAECKACADSCAHCIKICKELLAA